ncbi:DUF975 family protein [Lactococcus nasutitermitis]|uniref:DUF975 family protein n=1 Tax=Lactococcus nasutitermitis TaxID=1652957 RepID=A0ABV9JEE5_9LACT|nr:DUF975 family protein [Lactococcus nasutitermitis]
MERYEIKAQAKAALHENFGNKMLLFIIPILYGIFTTGNSIRTHFEQHSNATATATLAALGVIGVSLLFTVIIGLIVNIITVGAIFNYIKIFRKERENPQFSNIFIPFSDGSWVKILLLSVVKGILVILLTFTIVGIPFAIYLSLGWSQANYVLYDQLENGTYHGVMGVLHGSAEVMRGSRGNFFVFLLSFIGWGLLIGITSGLVGFWTTPYINMSLVAYYENLK